MSPAVTIAFYAIARNVLGEPLVFPGTTISYNQPKHSVAHHNAAFHVFAVLTEKAYDQAFNYTIWRVCRSVTCSPRSLRMWGERLPWAHAEAMR